MKKWKCFIIPMLLGLPIAFYYCIILSNEYRELTNETLNTNDHVSSEFVDNSKYLAIEQKQDGQNTESVNTMTEKVVIKENVESSTTGSDDNMFIFMNNLSNEEENLKILSLLGIDKNSNFLKVGDSDLYARLLDKSLITFKHKEQYIILNKNTGKMLSFLDHSVGNELNDSHSKRKEPARAEFVELARKIYDIIGIKLTIDENMAEMGSISLDAKRLFMINIEQTIGGISTDRTFSLHMSPDTKKIKYFRNDLCIKPEDFPDKVNCIPKLNVEQAIVLAREYSQMPSGKGSTELLIIRPTTFQCPTGVVLPHNGEVCYVIDMYNENTEDDIDLRCGVWVSAIDGRLIRTIR